MNSRRRIVVVVAPVLAGIAASWYRVRPGWKSTRSEQPMLLPATCHLRGATGTQRAAIAASTFGEAIWIGMVLVTLVVMAIDTATWMF